MPIGDKVQKSSAFSPGSSDWTHHPCNVNLGWTLQEIFSQPVGPYIVSLLVRMFQTTCVAA
jgi:hypothetical protein